LGQAVLDDRDLGWERGSTNVVATKPDESRELSVQRAMRFEVVDLLNIAIA
jgi:hypothetical protein